MSSTSHNALTVIDGFDDTDAASSPIRGTNIRFKDAEYFSFSEPFETKDRTFAAIDIRDGWQKLAEGCPPEYLMREPGKVRPPRPHVDEADWPLDFNGKPAHPWVLTRYMTLIDVNSGEVGTFSSNTIGGRVAFDELSQQVKFVRSEHPNAIAIIALESTMMPTQYGSKKPRPHFKIVGYKLRSNIGSQNLLTDETTPLVEAPKPPLNEEMGDDLPGDLAPPKPVKASIKATPKRKAG